MPVCAEVLLEQEPDSKVATSDLAHGGLEVSEDEGFDMVQDQGEERVPRRPITRACPKCGVDLRLEEDALAAAGEGGSGDGGTETLEAESALAGSDAGTGGGRALGAYRAP